MKKVMLLATLAILTGCGPRPEPAPILPPAPVERPEVQARRGALEVELAKVRGDWATQCMSSKAMPVMFEADRPSICLRMSRSIHPDTITAQLLSEFNGKLVD